MNKQQETFRALTPLYDGRMGIRGGLHVEVQPCTAPTTTTTETAPPVLEFIASSEHLDRYDEVIVASGWRLEAYRRNPVFQNAHQYGDIVFTLGKALVTEVREIGGRSVLYQRVEFAVEVNPFARIAYGLYKGGFLNAVSVGFIPLRWENGGQDAGFRRKYLEQELLEVSAVGIPANPEALQLGLKSGAVAGSDLREAAALLDAMLRQRGPTSPANASQAATAGGTGPLRQLFQLARDIHSVMARV